MPLVKRAEESILRLEPIIDIIVNPCALGTMGAGLSLAMRERFGEEMFKDYREKSLSGDLRLGNIHEWKDAKSGITLLNIPTKEHFANPAEVEIVKKSLRSIREYLQKSRYLTVVTPMIGGGYGQLPLEEAEPLNEDYLGDLPNIIHVSMLPKAFEKLPKYLAVIGSRVLDDRNYIETHVAAALKKWDMKITDFDAMISGGATKGVDVIACGRAIDHPSYKDSLAQKLGIRALIAEADWDRYGLSAGYKRNQTVIDIGTHVVALIDERKKKSVGTRQAIHILKNHNKHNPDNQKHLIGFSYKG